MKISILPSENYQLKRKLVSIIFADKSDENKSILLSLAVKEYNSVVKILDNSKKYIKLKTIKGSMYNINGKTICLRLIDKYV